MVTIDLFVTNAVIRGDYPLNEVDLATSYPVEGAQFSPAYRKGRWDGRKRLFSKRTGSFPIGLLDTVVEVCERHGKSPIINDHRVRPDVAKGDFDLHGVSFEGKYSYQLDVAKTAVQKGRGIIKAATNSGKTTMMAAITKYYNVPTLVIVPSVELLYQVRGVFKSRLGQDDAAIGIIGDSTWAPGHWVTIATPGTLISRLEQKECVDFLNTVDLLFIDECHRAGADELFTLANLCPAYFVFGMSGTPLDRSDGADLRLIALAGEVICDITNEMMVELGVSPPAHIVFDRITSPILPKKGITYQQAYKQGVSENPEVVRKVVEWTLAGRAKDFRILIFVEEINQGKAIDDALWNDTNGEFIPHQFIHGGETSDVRRAALEDFGKGDLPVLIVSRIVDEGIDLPEIDMLILAGSRKSKIRTLQRLGRGLRGERLIAVEFANFCHKHLMDHSLVRLNDYKAEKCFPIVQYKQDQDKVELLGKLWDAQAR